MSFFATPWFGNLFGLLVGGVAAIWVVVPWLAAGLHEWFPVYHRPANILVVCDPLEDKVTFLGRVHKANDFESATDRLPGWLNVSYNQDGLDYATVYPIVTPDGGLLIDAEPWEAGTTRTFGPVVIDVGVIATALGTRAPEILEIYVEVVGDRWGWFSLSEEVGPIDIDCTPHPDLVHPGL